MEDDRSVHWELRDLIEFWGVELGGPMAGVSAEFDGNRPPGAVHVLRTR